MKKIQIDKEIEQEIKELWEQGIKTIECCSGHGRDRGCIIVKKSSVKKMEELGYEREPNTGKWYSFYPKSIKEALKKNYEKRSRQN